MISGNRMYLNSILSVMAKPVNIYVRFFRIQFLINLQRLQTNFFYVVIMWYCLQNFKENNEFNQFWNKTVT